MSDDLAIFLMSWVGTFGITMTIFLALSIRRWTFLPLIGLALSVGMVVQWVEYVADREVTVTTRLIVEDGTP